MTTQEINTTRNDIVSGSGTTALVATVRSRLRAVERYRLVALVVPAAPVQPPADFAAAVAEVDARPAPKLWADDVNSEKIGEDYSQRPYSW